MRDYFSYNWLTNVLKQNILRKSHYINFYLTCFFFKETNECFKFSYVFFCIISGMPKDSGRLAENNASSFIGCKPPRRHEILA